MKDGYTFISGFKGKIRQKKYSFYQPIDKTIIRNLDKRNGDLVFYYYCTTKDGRPAIIAFMDGKNRFGKEGM
ncbi:MAG: hypothetical protein PHH61_00115 [Candidatus Nanoarchaeia archaeon]|nr:hypothetical protein [Candidatus Nanoarchaeia archaeon]